MTITTTKQPTAQPTLAPAVASEAAATKLYILIQTAKAFALPIGTVASLIQDSLTPGNTESLINSMRGGASVGSCFSKDEFYDPRPYFSVLSVNYPGFTGNPTRLLHDGIDRTSSPMIFAACLVWRDRLPELFSGLSDQQLRRMLLCLWLANSDKELRHLFRRAKADG